MKKKIKKEIIENLERLESIEEFHTDFNEGYIIGQISTYKKWLASLKDERE